MITIQILNQLWPKAPLAIKQCVVDGDRWLVETGIDTRLEVTHFMAQISHESGAGTVTTENMNYSAARMTVVWPSRFHSISEATPYANNPRALADKVYNGRMGNKVGTDDGYNFRGRGAVQTTGRDAYEKLSKTTGLDLIAHPEWLIDPLYWFRVACYDFVQCGCLPYAGETKANPKGDITMVTKRLNGGLIGFAERKAWFTKWETVLKGAPDYVIGKAETKPVIIKSPQDIIEQDFLMFGDPIPGAEGSTSAGGPQGPAPLVPKK